ncbi:MAG: hypothetical protein NC311_11380 [Muribaculaceae bacterium]|nr:hypothetical protein [Muribaculaceae bacterium]
MNKERQKSKEQLQTQIILGLLDVIKTNNIKLPDALKYKINALRVLFEE